MGAQGEKRKTKSQNKNKDNKKIANHQTSKFGSTMFKKIEMDPSQSFIVQSLDVFARHFFSLVFLYRSEIPSLVYGSGYSN